MPPEEVVEIPVALLVDMGSGQTLFARNPEKQFSPASMTKVMTAYVAFQEMAAGRLTLDRQFTVSEATARQWKGRGTSLYLDAGTTITTDELLRGIMTASANDASVVLAEGYTGNVEAFSFLMNDEARRLGMTNSQFNTPNGWPDGGKTYVSAQDLVKLARAMIVEHPNLYRRYAGKERITWQGRVLRSYDPTVGVVHGADGIKTGYTREAGYNFLGSAQRAGQRLLMVVGGARSSAERAEASRALLEWGFSAWKARPLFAKGTSVGTAQVQGGDVRSVELVAGKGIYATIPADGSEELTLRIIYQGPLKAPFSKGDAVARLLVRVGNDEPTSIPLYARRSVGKADPIDRLINGLMNLFS